MTALDELVGILDLEQIDDDVFIGESPQVSMQRVFGGQIAGQALMAAHRTVGPERTVHSLHSYFLRPGASSLPIRFAVEHLRDGRTFSTRRVVAYQRDVPIFTLGASFQVSSPGPEYASRMPDAPEPATLPTFADRLGGGQMPEGSSWLLQLPLDLRYVDAPPDIEIEPGREPRQMVWMKADGRLPDDPALHLVLATYASDLTLLDSAILGHGIPWASGRIALASLDHAMWFHRPLRIDDWLLYVQISPSAADSRAFCRGEIYRRDGALAVSVVQEGMARVTS